MNYNTIVTNAIITITRYVLRRILRRAIRFATEKLNAKPGALASLVDAAVFILVGFNHHQQLSIKASQSQVIQLFKSIHGCIPSQHACRIFIIYFNNILCLQLDVSFLKPTIFVCNQGDAFPELKKDPETVSLDKQK